MTWIAGNPVKIDSGANTNANIIVKTTVPTSTVPDVTLTDEGSATARIQGAGLTVGSVTPVVNFAAPGTVLAQNSPAGTVEPQGSPVDLTVSLGAVVVPDVTGVPLAEATREAQQRRPGGRRFLQQSVHRAGPRAHPGTLPAGRGRPR